MELTKDNFNEYYNEEYKEVNEEIESNLQGINEYLKKAQEKELVNPCNYMYNALSKTIKFLKNNNIDYYSKDNTNLDCELFFAIEDYLNNILGKATLQSFYLKERMNYDKEAITSHISYKALRKLHLVSDIELYKTIVNILKVDNAFDNYNSLCNTLAYFDPKINLGDAFDYYLPRLLQQVINYKKEYNDKRSINEMYYEALSTIMTAINKINDEELTKKINQAHINTIKNYNEQVKKLKKNKTI